MDSKDFQKRLLETFRIEAREHLAAMERYFSSLGGCDAEELDAHLEGVFRAAHSLKGAARAVDLRGVERICQELESRFSTYRKEQGRPDAAALALLHAATDRMAVFVDQDRVEPKEVDAVVASLQGRSNMTPSAAAAEEAVAAAEGSAHAGAAMQDSGPSQQRIETTRTATAALEDLFRKSEEVFSTCLVQEPVIAQIAGLRTGLVRQKAAIERVRRELSHVDSGDAIGILSEQVSAIETAEADCAQLLRTCTNNFRQLRRGVSDVLDAVKRLQMLPLRTIFEPLPRLVRNLARDCGKEIHLETIGEDIHIDKQVLENLADPLVHLLRNGVDHGIEAPQDREAAGKAGTGRIRLFARPLDAGTIEIVVRDDGRGVDLERLRERAVAAGLLSEAEAAALSERETYALVFRSGLSTRPMVTELSGRGLGLAIVQEKVAALGGDVQCQPVPGGGTQFILRIPLTITTTRVIEVQSGQCSFFVPGNYVVEALRLPRSAIQEIAGHAAIHFRARIVRIGVLSELLGLAEDSATAQTEYLSVMVLRSGDQEAAVIFDTIGAEREVIVKPLGPQLLHVPMISGASLGPGGKVVLVIDCAGLVDAVRRGVSTGAAAPGASGVPAEPPLVLVVDDSVTSRTLLRDIMKSSGYRVDTAVDGVEALTRLREREFDLVVSDVDMPRLNGFELVRKIRNDKKLEELPVILVTSLDSREDRERGMEVGASAYIVKTSFEQSNLLEIARRFV